MSLLLTANADKLAPYGIPRSGLVSIIDPWRDTYGRNILPVGSENFVTGWTNGSSETCTITDYPITINGQVVIAKRITGNGLGSTITKYSSSPIAISNSILSCYCMLLSGNAIVANDAGANPQTITATMRKISLASTSGYATIKFRTALATDTLDILVYQPQVNLGTLYPYAPPSGLPQSTLDYSGHGNTFQLGSTAGADTNDPAWSGNGLVFGADDYCLAPAISIPAEHTIISVIGYVNNASTTKVLLSTTAYEEYFGFNPSGTILASALYDGTQKTLASDTSLTVGKNYCIGKITHSKYFSVCLNNNKKDSVNYTSRPASFILSKLGAYTNSTLQFNNNFYFAVIYNRALSDAEYMQAYNGLRRLMSSRGVVI